MWKPYWIGKFLRIWEKRVQVLIEIQIHFTKGVTNDMWLIKKYYENKWEKGTFRHTQNYILENIFQNDMLNEW